MSRAFINRVGEIRISNEGYEMKIVECNNYNDIWVEFQDEYKGKIHTEYQNFLRGSCKNPYHKSVYNIGFYGKGKYEKGKHRQCYKVWCHMLERCYSPYFINKHLTYIDCFVCEEWHNFQNFAKWYYDNYYEIPNEKMALDKDILIKGNKIYSPNTCVFVPQRINSLFTKSNKSRSVYPIGVNKHKRDNILEVTCSIIKNGEWVQKYLGRFPLNRPFQAFTCYKNFKENYIKQVADEYKDLIPTELYNAMYRYEVEIND